MEEPLIAILEKELLIALDMADALEKAGFRVWMAAAASTAMRAAATTGRPAAVVADARLRGEEDGITVVQTLRDLCGPSLVVIFSSSLDDQDTKARAAACAPLAFFTKPTDAGLIVAALRQALLP